MESIERKENLKSYLEKEGLIFPKEPIKEFYSQIFKLSGFGIGGIINISGKKAGVVGAQIIKRFIENKDELRNPKKLFEHIKEFLEDTNICKINEFEAKENEITFSVSNSIFAEAVNNSKKPVCIPLSGAISGFLEEITGKKWECKEEKCSSQGEDKCLFHAYVKKSPFG